jgi:HAD superfamily hydrolase (TIGR01509 family)
MTSPATDVRPSWPRALLFDLDLTLIRSRPFWRRAEQHLLKHLGFDEAMDVHHCYNGLNARDAAIAIHHLLQPDVPVAQCVEVFREALISEFAVNSIEAMPGAMALVQRYTGRLPMAIASGSPQEAIHLAARALGIDDQLGAAISSESVAKGKPEPDVFLEAARLLGVEPAQCVVFEDSVVGAAAALAAGIPCIVAPDQPIADFAGMPVYLVKDLTEVDDDLFAKLRRV